MSNATENNETMTYTYSDLERLSKMAAGQRGQYEVRCCELVTGRYANLSFAIRMAQNLEAKTDAPVTIH